MNTWLSVGEKFREVSVAVKRAIRSMVSNPDDVEDLVQETFVKLLNVQDRLPVDADRLLAYAFRTGKNVAIDHLRQRSRHGGSRTVPLDTVGSGDWDEDGVCSHIPVVMPVDPCQAELRESIERVLEQLPVKLCEALVLHSDGYTYGEIACKQSAKLGTVKSRIFRARKQAGEILAVVIA